MLHDNQQVNSRDRFFVCGGNPDNDGGGVITSFNDLTRAREFQRIAIMEGYTKVRILTWEELNSKSME